MVRADNGWLIVNDDYIKIDKINTISHTKKEKAIVIDAGFNAEFYYKVDNTEHYISKKDYQDLVHVIDFMVREGSK